MTKTTEPIGSLVYEQMELKKKAKDPHNTEITQEANGPGGVYVKYSQDAGTDDIFACRAYRRD